MRGVTAAVDHRRGDAEVGRGRRGDGHRRPAGELDARRVGDEAGLVVDHLVADVQRRAEGGVHALGGAHRDDELRARVVAHAVALQQVLRDELAQLDHPAVGGVVRLPGLEAGDGGAGDRLRRREVRLADGEADDVLHLGQHVEEAANARRRHRADAVVQEVCRWRGPSLGRASSSCDGQCTQRVGALPARWRAIPSSVVPTSRLHDFTNGP